MTFTNGQEIHIQDNNEVVVTSTGASAAVGDVGIILIHDGCTDDASGATTTVYRPASLSLKNIDDDPWVQGSFTGYKSSHYYRILNQFGSVLPNPVDVNETFDTPTVSDYPGENWPDRPPFGEGSWSQANPSNWCDVVAAATQSGATPPAQTPQTPLGNVKVQHYSGTFRVGSTANGYGVAVKTVTWQFYQDHGRHE